MRTKIMMVVIAVGMVMCRDISRSADLVVNFPGDPSGLTVYDANLIEIGQVGGATFTAVASGGSGEYVLASSYEAADSAYNQGGSGFPELGLYFDIYESGGGWKISGRGVEGEGGLKRVGADASSSMAVAGSIVMRAVILFLILMAGLGLYAWAARRAKLRV